ncbi:MAG: class I SAM-dependent methyltransferase [Fimbriimonadaceae bacterium]|nr:class I SAM-dependent methyltransferase [Chitinophagales bacterium]
MLKHEAFNVSDKLIWADLGCGSGTFTAALAHLLNKDSIIHAIDLNNAALQKIPETIQHVVIKKHHADFIKMQFPFENADGILMANSLHYIEDKLSFLKRIKTHLKKGNCFLIIEYDTEITNPWVPYPVNFQSLKELFKQCGYTSITKLHERNSVYNRAMMYSTFIK